MAGFLTGSLCGFVIGTVLGLSRTADVFFPPIFNGLRQIALLAWIPLISIWFGVGEAAKIVFIMAAALVPMVMHTYQGVRTAPTQLIEVARALTFTKWQMLTRLYIPSSMPSIATGARLAPIDAWVACVGAEYFITVGPGLGGLTIAGRERFQMDLVLRGIMVLGIVGFLIDRAASAVETRLLRWREA